MPFSSAKGIPLNAAKKCRSTRQRDTIGRGKEMPFNAVKKCRSTRQKGYHYTRQRNAVQRGKEMPFNSAKGIPLNAAKKCPWTRQRNADQRGKEIPFNAAEKTGNNSNIIILNGEQCSQKDKLLVGKLALRVTSNHSHFSERSTLDMLFRYWLSRAACAYLYTICIS